MNVEKVWGARYKLGAHYLSKNTVLEIYSPTQACTRIIYLPNITYVFAMF
jgi:hypothetical protein